jgi:HD-GYP domain-containing protein (c-di-GMP phosphodiesterase class II)
LNFFILDDTQQSFVGDDWVRKILITRVQENQKLGKTIYDEMGRVLLREGTPLSNSLVLRLQVLGIKFLYIEDQLSEGISIEEVVPEEVIVEAKNSVRKMIRKFSASGDTNYQGVIKSTGAIIDEVLENKDVLMSVTDIRSKDEFLFAHATSVCSMATATAIKMGYNVSKLKDIAIGALLHDIGKIKLLKDNHLNQDQYNTLEDSLRKSHAKIGYDMLGEKIEIGTVSKVMALLHHEHMDGSGYPMGLVKDKIHESARILSVCNAFDNMVTGNSEYGDIPNYQAIEYLTNSPAKFDPEIVKIFAANIALYPNGTAVELNNGLQGIVVRQNRGMPSRPVIRVVVDQDQIMLTAPYEIDLLSALNVMVNRSVDIGV